MTLELKCNLNRKCLRSYIDCHLENNLEANVTNCHALSRRYENIYILRLRRTEIINFFPDIVKFIAACRDSH